MSMQAIVIANIRRIPWVRRERGFTLLEALLAIAVLGFGFVTTMAFHGDLLGSAGENRIRSTAMSLAEARLEALRAQPFDTLSAGTFEDTTQLQGFGFLSLQPVTLKRCWVIVDETELKRVQVAVSRVNDDCAPWGDSTLVTLTSRIANNNFARAGVLTLGDSLFNPDGFGELLPDTDERIVGDPTLLPGGFQLREFDLPGEGSNGFAMCDSGVCLVPDVDAEGNQNFATINGNIFLSGRTCTTVGDGTLAERCGIDLVIEGNGLCRLHYPDESSAPPSLPTASGVESFNYIRYSCVVADQWRRSISVVPEETEKVCVGNPGLVLADGDPSDQLSTITRFYDGRRNAAFDAEGNLVDENPHGLKGGPLTGDLQAIIGTVCASDEDDCWDDPSSRGLVPGGHHFLVMPTAGGTCSARMEQLADVDTENDTYYSNLFVRNPDIFFCTSAKDYEGDFCTTFTRSSGFIANNSDQSLVADDLVILPRGSGLLQACSFFGALGEDGGGYICGLRHDVAEARITGVSLNELLVFESPDNYLFDGLTDDYLPATFPIDATARDFSIVDANLPPTVAIRPECVDLTCTFIGSAIDSDGTIDGDSYSWSFGDGEVASGAIATVTHTYAAAGTYVVALRVADNDGAIGVATTTVTVSAEGANNAPSASLTFECTELSCLFVPTATDSDGSIASLTWDFGDGTTLSGGIGNVTHVYSAAGDYTATLTVTDDQGASASVSQSVSVSVPVVEVRCNIAVTGIKQSNNAVVAISIAGDAFVTCGDVGKDGYQCIRTNVLDGSPAELRATRSGSHPVLGHEFVVNCSAPTFNYDFN
jgi:PKD repeat protein/Tfp pilus assembly protein PilV